MGFSKRKQDFPFKKLYLVSALVSIVLSRVTPGIIKITLFALIHFAYLFMCICLINILSCTSHACSKGMRSTHMHVFISAQMYIHVHTFIHLRRHTSVYYIYVFLVSLYACTYVCVCVCVCMYCMHARMLAYLSCMCVNVCLHACVHRWWKGRGYGAIAPPNFKDSL